MQISNVASGKISKWVNSINWVDSYNFFFFFYSLQTTIQWPWDGSYCIPSGWSDSGWQHRGGSFLNECHNCTQERSERQQPLSCCSGDLLTLCSPGPCSPTRGTWTLCKENHLPQKPPQLDLRALISYGKCYLKKLLCRDSRLFPQPSLHQAFTTEILLLTSPWHWMEAQSTPHTPPSRFLHDSAHPSLLCQLFTSPSQGITVCAPAAGLSLPCDHCPVATH